MIFKKFCGQKCLSHVLSQSAVSSQRSTKTREVTDQSQLPYYELAEEDGGTNGRNVRGQSCRLFFEFLCCARRFFSKELFFSSSQDNWKRFVNFTSKWLMFDCKEREIVAETAMKLGLNFRDVESYITAQPTCANLATTRPLLLFYQRFCDISKMTRKEKKAPAVGGYKTQFHFSEN